MRKSLKKVVSLVLTGVMAVAVASTASPAYSSADVAEGAAKHVLKEDLSGATTYHATFAFQTDPGFIFRNAWFQSYGQYDTNKDVNDKTDIQSEVRDEKYAGTYFDKVIGWASDNNTAGLEPGQMVSVPGTLQDVEIKGNGTYTVGVYGLENALHDGTNFDEQTKYNLLFFSTDMPASMKKTVKFSDIKVTIDGVETPVADGQWLFDPDAIEDPKCLNLLLINNWNTEIDKTLESAQVARDSIYITFTVSGFDVDDADANGQFFGGDKSSSKASSGSDAATSGDSDDSKDKKGNKMPLFIGIGAGVVVVIIIIAVVAGKKKD